MITEELGRMECSAIAAGLRIAVRCGEVAMRIAPDETDYEAFADCQKMVELLASIFRNVESATITLNDGETVN